MGWDSHQPVLMQNHTNVYIHVTQLKFTLVSIWYNLQRENKVA